MGRKIAIGFGIIFLVIFMGFVWGIGIEPRLILDVEEETAVIPDLPAAWEGRRVAVLGDFQVGLWWDNDGMVREAVDAILEQKPALVLITGDFIYHAPEDPQKEIARTADMLRPLTAAGFPVYGVLGNHDYSMVHRDGNPNFDRAENVRRAMESVGIKMLRNEAVLLDPPAGNRPPDGPALWLVGIGAYWPEVADIDQALSRVQDDAPRLVLMHHPDTFARFPAGTAPFAVAGHTHGGQVALPFMPEWTWMDYYRSDEIHADGWIDGYGKPGNDLYVNRGIGCSIAPIRINARPELTMFTLKRGRRNHFS